MGISIKGMGYYTPENVLTNFDLEKIVDTSDEWITTRTGIKERRIAKEESLVDMAYMASLKALQEAGLSAEDVDVIILATLTPDLGFPASACLLQARLGCHRAYAFDISAACSGFLYGLEIASALLSSGRAKNILLVGAEKLSQIVNWTDRSTCVLFGDGAGAVVLSSEGEGDLLASVMRSDGNYWEILYAERCGHINMKGKELFTGMDHLTVAYVYTHVGGAWSVCAKEEKVSRFYILKAYLHTNLCLLLCASWKTYTVYLKDPFYKGRTVHSIKIITTKLVWSFHVG